MIMKQRSLISQVADADIRLLKVFKVVAECGGVSAAEVELNVGRSTISKQLKDLEVRLGMTLCRRGRSGFGLTPEGQAVYASLLRLLASIDDFRADLNDLQRNLTGTITLALFDKMATHPDCKVPQAIARFQAQANQANLEIFVEPLNEIERGVIEGRFHCGVIPHHRTSSSLAYQSLFHEQMWLYCSRQHPLAQRHKPSSTDVLTASYAGLGYHSPNMEAAHKQGLQRKATAYDQEGIVHLILSGAYIGYLPDHYAALFERQGLLVRLHNPTFGYRCQFDAIWRTSPKPSRLTALFLDCLRQVHTAEKV